MPHAAHPITCQPSVAIEMGRGTKQDCPSQSTALRGSRRPSQARSPAERATAVAELRLLRIGSPGRQRGHARRAKGARADSWNHAVRWRTRTAPPRRPSGAVHTECFRKTAASSGIETNPARTVAARAPLSGEHRPRLECSSAELTREAWVCRRAGHANARRSQTSRSRLPGVPLCCFRRTCTPLVQGGGGVPPSPALISPRARKFAKSWHLRTTQFALA